MKNNNGGFNLYIPKNNTLFVSVMLIFILFTIIMFLNPSVILFMFNTILGNLLLIFIVFGVGMLDIKYAIGMSAIFIMIYQAFHIANKKYGVKEGLFGMGGVSIVVHPALWCLFRRNGCPPLQEEWLPTSSIKRS